MSSSAIIAPVGLAETWVFKQACTPAPLVSDYSTQVYNAYMDWDGGLADTKTSNQWLVTGSIASYHQWQDQTPEFYGHWKPGSNGTDQFYMSSSLIDMSIANSGFIAFKINSTPTVWSTIWRTDTSLIAMSGTSVGTSFRGSSLQKDNRGWTSGTIHTIGWGKISTAERMEFMFDGFYSGGPDLGAAAESQNVYIGGAVGEPGLDCDIYSLWMSNMYSNLALQYQMKNDVFNFFGV